LIALIRKKDVRVYFPGSFNESKFRYERKFIIQHSSKKKLFNDIKLHPASLKEIFFKRKINNIYFDKYDLDYFKNNIQGNSERSKIRLRWYGDENTIKPKLEIKIKRGLVGKKFVLSLEKVNLVSREMTSSIISQVLKKNKLNAIKSKILLPTLYNSYSRRYFISADSNFRITIDQDQIFRSTNHNLSNPYKLKSDALIMEIKYHRSQDHLIDGLTQHFPFRVSKNSKYVNGIKMIYRFKKFW